MLRGVKMDSPYRREFINYREWSGKLEEGECAWFKDGNKLFGICNVSGRLTFEVEKIK